MRGASSFRSSSSVAIQTGASLVRVLKPRGRHRHSFGIFPRAPSVPIAMKVSTALTGLLAATTGMVSAQVTTLGSSNFDAEVVSGGKNAIVKFYAPWCARFPRTFSFSTDEIRGPRGSAARVVPSPSFASPPPPDRPSLPTRPPGAGTARPWPPRGTSSATPTRAPPPS
jgi:hypothetical protein